MRLLSLRVSALLLVSLLAAPALAAHPSLFYSAPEVDALRTRAAGSHNHIYRHLFNGTTQYLNTSIAPTGIITWRATGQTLDLGDRRDIGNSLVVFAFVAQLSTDPRYFDLAKDWLMTVASWGNFDLDGTKDLIQSHMLGGVAVAYDILAPRLSATEAATVRASLVQNANALTLASKSGIWWAGEYLQNHNWVNHAAIGLAALAVQGEVPSTTTQPWLDLATLNAQRMKQLLDGISDGTWLEGVGYAYYGYSWHLPFVSALKRLTNVDLGDIGNVKGHAALFARMQIPEQPHHFVLAHGDFYSFSRDYGLLTLRYAASRYKDGLAQAVANAWVAGAPTSGYVPNLNQRVFEFFFYDATVAPVSLSSQSLDFYGKDLQAAVFRSGWDKGSTIFAMKNGPIGGWTAYNWQTTQTPFRAALNFSHVHADDNGFYLYGAGSWLAPEAQGYYIGHRNSPLPAATQTVFHNALTVDGQGQLGEGVRLSGDEAGSYSWYSGRKGGIPFFGSTKNHGYAIGEGANLYPASMGLRRWDRHALFLDRKWVVIRDVIQATTPHVYGWTCHFMNGATQEGNWLHGIGENGQALGVAVVAPASFGVTVTAQRPVHVGNFNKNGAVYAAEVKPAAAASTVFLAALIQTPEVSWAARPAVNAIDPNFPDAGIRIREGTTTTSLAVFNDAPTQTRKVGSFTLAGLTGVLKYENGIPIRVMLVQGTSLTDTARTLISQATPTGALEADGLTSTVLSLTGTGIARPRIYAPYATQVRWNGQDVSFARDGDFVVVGVDSAGNPPDSGVSTSSASSPDDTVSGSAPSGPVVGEVSNPTAGPVSEEPRPTVTGVAPGSPGPIAGVRTALSCDATGGKQLAAFGMGIILADLLLRRRRRGAGRGGLD
jgi:hypothetical protein